MTQGWAEGQAQRVAREVRRLRGNRSAQWLSDRTSDLGYTVTRSVIADLESGRRKYVTTAELCVLAWALRVPPVRLLYPDLPDGPVEIIPAALHSSIVAATWFSGEKRFMPELVSRDEAESDEEWQRDAEHAAELSSGARLLDLSRERIALKSRIEWMAKVVARLRNSEDPSLADQFVDDIVTAEKNLKAVNARIRELGEGIISDGDD